MRRLTAFAFLLLAATAAAQEIEVPVETQVPILLKVLGFDRKVANHAGEPLRIGILYQPKVHTSRAVYDAFREAAEKSGIKSVAERVIAFVPIEIDDEQQVARKLAGAAIDALYVTPLRAVRIAAIVEITRQRHITTLTGVPEYVVDGVTVGLGIRGARPEIVVNLASLKLERAEFSAQLLKIVRIVE
jgi:hypothetical protein